MAAKHALTITYATEHNLVDQRIKVRHRASDWSLPGAWQAGTVVAYVEVTGKHLVKFDRCPFDPEFLQLDGGGWPQEDGHSIHENYEDWRLLEGSPSLVSPW